MGMGYILTRPNLSNKMKSLRSEEEREECQKKKTRSKSTIDLRYRVNNCNILGDSGTSFWSSYQCIQLETYTYVLCIFV